MRPEGQVSRGGIEGAWLSETELRSKFAIGGGGGHFECVDSLTVKITIQIQHFVENYGKQTLKGILLSSEKSVF